MFLLLEFITRNDQPVTVALARGRKQVQRIRATCQEDSQGPLNLESWLSFSSSLACQQTFYAYRRGRVSGELTLCKVMLESAITPTRPELHDWPVIGYLS